MKVSIDKLKINPEYEKLVPTLSTSDYETLRDSLDKFGFREAYPVVINRDNEILDGHHRYKICKEIGLTEIPVQIEEFENKLDEKEWVILTNIARRQLSIGQKGELFLAILEIERERAKKRQLSTLKQFSDTVPTPRVGTVKEQEKNENNPSTSEIEEISEKNKNEEKGEAVEIAAKKVGISKKTGYQVLKIKKAAEEHDEVKKSWQDAVNGKKSVAEVYREAVRIEKNEKIRDETEKKIAKEKTNLTDIERINLLEKDGEKILKIYNLWNFNQRDIRIGKAYPGNIPGQIMINLLYYYTEQGDLVVDPMAGGGSTIDACSIMGRRCLAYDINPDAISLRNDIIYRDLVKDGFAPETKNCKMVFLDPPYWTQKKGNYSNNTTDLSNMELDDFYKAMRKIFNESYDILQDGGIIAVIVGPTQEKGIIYDHAFVFYRMLSERFSFVNRIIVPYNTQQVTAFHVADAKRGKYMLKLYRDLLVFRKD